MRIKARITEARTRTIGSTEFDYPGAASIGDEISFDLLGEPAKGVVEAIYDAPMKTNDPQGNINPEYVRASGRADSLVSECLLAIRKGQWPVALEKLDDARKWLNDLANDGL